MEMSFENVGLKWRSTKPLPLAISRWLSDWTAPCTASHCDCLCTACHGVTGAREGECDFHWPMDRRPIGCTQCVRAGRESQLSYGSLAALKRPKALIPKIPPPKIEKNRPSKWGELPGHCSHAEWKCKQTFSSRLYFTNTLFSPTVTSCLERRLHYLQ